MKLYTCLRDNSQRFSDESRCAPVRKARITLLHALSYSNAERFVWPTDKRKQSLILGEHPCLG